MNLHETRKIEASSVDARVSVTGKMDGTLFSSRELDATSVLTLSRENRDKKTSSPSGKKK